MEPQLRKLGLHTSLKKGVVYLDSDFTICKKGDKLNPEQARLLVGQFKLNILKLMFFIFILFIHQKLFDIMQATFKVYIKMYWNKSGQFEVFDTSMESLVDDEDEEEDGEGSDAEDQKENDENNNEQGSYF